MHKRLFVILKLLVSDVSKLYPLGLDFSLFSLIIIERGLGFLTLFIVNILLISFFTDLIFSSSFSFAIELIIIFVFLFLLFTFLFKPKALSFLERIKIRFNLFEKFRNFVRVLVSINERRTIFASFIYYEKGFIG